MTTLGKVIKSALKVFDTEDGCTYTEDIIIIEPPLLTATSALTIPLTCSDGEITV